jgi:hypothetical protein
MHTLITSTSCHQGVRASAVSGLVSLPLPYLDPPRDLHAGYQVAQGPHEGQLVLEGVALHLLQQTLALHLPRGRHHGYGQDVMQMPDPSSKWPSVELAPPMAHSLVASVCMCMDVGVADRPAGFS